MQVSGTCNDFFNVVAHLKEAIRALVHVRPIIQGTLAESIAVCYSSFILFCSVWLSVSMVILIPAP